MKTNFSNELVATIMILLQQTFKQQIFLDTEDMIFLRKEITESGNIYYPITNKSETTNPSPILHLNESKLLNVFDVAKAEKSVEKRIFSELKAVQMRTTYREESVNERIKSVPVPTNKHNTSRTKSEMRADNKRIKTLRYHGLEPFHDTYTDNRFFMILEFEKTTAEMLSDGSDNVKAWAKENFKKAQQIAKTDIHNLTLLIEKTNKKRNQQLAAIRTNTKKIQKKKFGDKLKIYISVAVVAFALIFSIFVGIKNKINNSNIPVQITDTQTQTQSDIYTENEIISLINKYEIEQNTKIYDWRRSQIIACFDNKQITEAKAYKIIDSIATYNYTTTTTNNKSAIKTSSTNGIGYNPKIQTTYTGK